MAFIEELTSKIIPEVKKEKGYIPFSGERFVGAARLDDGEMNLTFIAAITMREADKWTSYEMGDYYRGRLAALVKQVGPSRSHKVLLKASIWFDVSDDLIFHVLENSKRGGSIRCDEETRRRIQLAANMLKNGSSFLEALLSPTDQIEYGISDYASKIVREVISLGNDLSPEIDLVEFYVVPKNDEKKLFKYLDKVREATGDEWEAVDDPDYLARYFFML